MSSATPDKCSTCYGEGEVHSDAGPSLCPDCEGSGRVLWSGELIESRIREIESRLQTPDGDAREAIGEPSVRWLIYELRRTRKALNHVLAYSSEQGDASESAALLGAIRKLAHDAVGLSNPARPAELLPEDG